MVVVPLYLEPDLDSPGQMLPFVDVEVGEVIVRALLDSGSARTALMPPRNVITHPRRSAGTSAFGIAGDQQAWQTSIRLGGYVLGPMEIDAPGTDGRDCIGQDVLSQFRCEYRFADRQLRLNAPAAADVDVYIGQGRHVYLDTVWPANETTASAVFDTGASVTVVDAAFVAVHPSLFVPAGISQGTDASGTIADTPMVTMAGPQILGRSFASSMAAVVDLSAANGTVERRMDLILGWPILTQANWIIDHPSRRAALTR